MSGPLSDVVSITISADTVNPTRAGFGKALIVSHTATWVDGLVRDYSSIAEVLLDFATTTPEYKAAAKYFAQNPRPDTLYIGKCPTQPTQRWAITPTAVNGYKYELTIDGTAVSFTADSTATVTEIIAGLKIAIDALGKAITVSDQTTYMRIVANAAGAWFNIGTQLNGSDMVNPNIAVAQDHADPGIATDLAALLLANSSWFGLVTTHNSKAVIDATAAWAESNKRLYIAQTQDTAVINTALSGTDDVGESTKGNAYTLTSVQFSQANGDFLDAALLGKRLPTDPGEETWKFAQLASVLRGQYTSTQRANMRAKNVGFFEDTAGVNITNDGKVASGGFIDFSRYLAYLQARLAERIFTVLAAAEKVPFNDRGIALIEAEVRGQLAEDEGREALLSGWTVTVPKSADVSAADRTSRTLNNVQFQAAYAGAIHKVVISGVVVP